MAVAASGLARTLRPRSCLGALPVAPPVAVAAATRVGWSVDGGEEHGMPTNQKHISEKTGWIYGLKLETLTIINVILI